LCRKPGEVEVSQVGQQERGETQHWAQRRVARRGGADGWGGRAGVPIMNKLLSVSRARFCLCFEELVLELELEELGLELEELELELEELELELEELELELEELELELED
jgi:hypothetical protein